jgi:hypothetical protein
LFVNGEVSVNRGAFRATKPYRAKILAIETTPAAATDAAVRMKEKNEAPLGQKNDQRTPFVVLT